MEVLEQAEDISRELFPPRDPFAGRGKATVFPAIASRVCWWEAMERCAGLVLLILATPAIAIAAIALSIKTRSSPFVAHLRVGLHHRPFWMFKLRTMSRTDASGSESRRVITEGRLVEKIIAEPSEDGAKNPEDPRVASSLAAFCRRHSIDELPQLWHVVTGEMSLVGPRPLTRIELIRHYGEHTAELLSVKPGLTGFWQIRGRSRIHFPERAAMDLELVRALNAKNYIATLLRTLPAVLTGKGAW